MEIKRILLLISIFAGMISCDIENKCTISENKIARNYEIKGIVYNKHKIIGKRVYTLFAVDGEDTISGMDIGFFYKCAFNDIQKGDYILKERGDSVFKIYRGDKEYIYKMRCDGNCD
jgi:hypothetical protein